MDYSAIFNISATGMDYQMLRVETIANNIANVGATRNAQGSLYQPLQVIAHSGATNFGSVLESLSLNGIEAIEVTSREQPVKQVFDPEHPDANADGFIEIPNINMVTEMTSLMEATRAYEANVRVMNAAKQIAMKALEIGK